MIYLTKKDLLKLIQSDSLSQVIGNDTTILDAAEQTAVEEAQSYLIQRFDTVKEFNSTDKWVPTATYQAGEKVYLDADLYSQKSYAVGDLALVQNTVYRCKTAISVGEAFNATKWDAMGLQYAIFSAKYPNAEFDFKNQYAIGDIVYWAGKNYRCKIESKRLTHGDGLQYRTYENLPLQNIQPDNTSQGFLYWEDLGSYSVPANTLITNTVYWLNSDTRSQQLVSAVTDICLYHLHSRISPRNIPDLRVKRYDDAIKWLKMAMNGEVTPNLPLKKPDQGMRIRYGGNLKNINTY